MTTAPGKHLRRRALAVAQQVQQITARIDSANARLDMLERREADR